MYNACSCDLNIWCTLICLLPHWPKRAATPIFSPSLPSPCPCSRFFGARSGIVLGDFNAHSALFGSPSTDARRRQLEDDMEASAYVALNTGAPTFLSNATGSTSHLDLAMASAPLARRCTWTVLDDSMGSD